MAVTRRSAPKEQQVRMMREGGEVLSLVLTGRGLARSGVIPKKSRMAGSIRNKIMSAGKDRKGNIDFPEVLISGARACHFRNVKWVPGRLLKKNRF
jgi:hypothetical protein